MIQQNKRNRGILNITPQNAKNLHPKLAILDLVNYRGSFDLDTRIFFIEYDILDKSKPFISRQYKYSVLSEDIDFIVQDVKKFIEGENVTSL